MDKEQLENELDRIEREIEDLFDEKASIVNQLEKLFREETVKIPVRNGHGQDYLDYEGKTNPGEVSEQV